MRLNSSQDKSVNFVEDALQGFLESRYVRKCDEYFICYLSSQSGCNQGCRFCHLTATKQTKFEDVLPMDYLSQASKVLKHYVQSGVKARMVHYNFMARGEALANPYMLDQADSILYDLGKVATAIDPMLGVRFNVSTIMPKALDRPLQQVFRVVHPTIYYSLYSVDEDFRKRWMPQAMPVTQALSALREYQVFSKKTIKIHQCFIEGENDSFDDVEGVLQALRLHDLDVQFNVVRYNPFSGVQGVESPYLHRIIQWLKKDLGPHRVKEIPRVGYDVKASCGMFVEKGT
jgi:23S rRNA (adenine2503-C2)-methyltransferase